MPSYLKESDSPRLPLESRLKQIQNKQKFGISKRRLEKKQIIEIKLQEVSSAKNFLKCSDDFFKLADYMGVPHSDICTQHKLPEFPWPSQKMELSSAENDFECPDELLDIANVMGVPRSDICTQHKPPEFPWPSQKMVRHCVNIIIAIHDRIPLRIPQCGNAGRILFFVAQSLQLAVKFYYKKKALADREKK